MSTVRFGSSSLVLIAAAAPTAWGQVDSSTLTPQPVGGLQDSNVLIDNTLFETGGDANGAPNGLSLITRTVSYQGIASFDHSGVVNGGVRLATTAPAGVNSLDFVNRGIIDGAVRLAEDNATAGDDTVSIFGFAQVGSFYDGGAEVDPNVGDTFRLVGDFSNDQQQLSLNGRTVFIRELNLNNVRNFERLVKDNGLANWSIFGNAEFQNGISIGPNGSVALFGGFVTGDTRIQAGGRYETFGVLNGNVNNFGTLASFSTNAPVTITGNLNLNSGSNIEVLVGANGGGSFQVLGAANLQAGTTVDVVEAFSIFDDTNVITLIEADGGITGPLPTVTKNLPFLDITSVQIVGNELQVTLSRNGTGFAAPAETENQTNVGRIWELINFAAAGSGSDAEGIATDLDGQAPADRIASFDQLSGEALAASARVGTQASRGFNQGLQRRSRLMGVAIARGENALPTPAFASATSNSINDMALLSAAAMAQSGRSLRQFEAFTPGLWVDVIGGEGDFEGDDGFSDVDYDYFGAVGGFDFALTNDWITGFAVGYNAGSFDSSDLGTDGDTDSIYLGWYTAFTQDRWRFTGGMSYAFDEYDTTRNFLAGGTARSASADYDGNTFGLDVGAAYRIDLPHEAVLEPFGTLEYVNSQTDAYTETGAAAANLTVGEQTFEAFYTTVGARIYRHYQWGKIAWTPELRAGWQHEWLDDDARIKASFTTAGVPTPFDVNGTDPDDDAALLGAGITADFDRNFSLRLDYNARLASDQTDHQLALALRIPW